MINTEITNFFSIANTKIKLIEEVRKHFGKEASPRFNSFDFWWIDENKVSQILAFFLDPNQNHEQGDIYLKHFLNKYGLEHFTFDNNSEVNVQCELLTSNGRFIDIVVYKNSFDWAIGIENKINLSTVDQYEQLIDYDKFLKYTTNDNYCLVYLAPKDKIINQSSMSSAMQCELKEQKRFKHLTYEEHLIGCISEFAMMTESIRVRSFLKDFEKTLRKRYMGEKDMEAKEAIVEMMKESDMNLVTSCLIYNSWLEMQQQLKEKFKLQLLSLKNEMDLEIVDYNDNKVWLRPKGWKKHSIGYMFERNENDVYFGISQDVQVTNKDKFNDLLNYVNSELDGGFKYSSWWPIYKYLDTNIVSNSDFWIAVKNGTAKEEIKYFIKVLVQKYQTDDEF